MEVKETKYVYGLKGIQDLFHISKSTAQKLKDTILADAVSQHGKIILVDTEKAFQLFKEQGKKQ